MTEEQKRQADIERFKICTRAIFPAAKVFPPKLETVQNQTTVERFDIGVWTERDDVIMVTASYKPKWKTGHPRDEYWVTGFNNVSREVTAGFGVTTTAIVTGQTITYTEKDFMSYLKRVKTLLETKVWDGKVIC